MNQSSIKEQDESSDGDSIKTTGTIQVERVPRNLFVSMDPAIHFSTTKKK